MWFVPPGSRIIRPAESEVVKKGNPQEAMIDYDGICIDAEEYFRLRELEGR